MKTIKSALMLTVLLSIFAQSSFATLSCQEIIDGHHSLPPKSYWQITNAYLTGEQTDQNYKIDVDAIKKVVADLDQDLKNEYSIDSYLLYAIVNSMTPEILGALNHLISTRDGLIEFRYTIIAYSVDSSQAIINLPNVTATDFNWIYNGPLERIVETAHRKSEFAFNGFSLSEYPDLVLGPILLGFNVNYVSSVDADAGITYDVTLKDGHRYKFYRAKGAPKFKLMAE